MDVGAPFVADGQPPVLAEPGEGPFHDPAMPAQALAGVDPFAGDAHADVALRQRPATAWDVVGLVGVQLVGALTPVSVGLFDGGHGIEHLLEDHRLVAVGSGQQFRQWETTAVGENVPFGARFTAIGGVRADEVAPLLAGTLAQSRLARDQSIWPASPRRSSSTRWSASQTPWTCQSRSRRQQVMPEPHPISWGNISQGMPDFSTKRMPVKQARSGTRGRPPLGLGGSGGSSGATTAHRSSLTSGLAMRHVYHASPGFDRRSKLVI